MTGKVLTRLERALHPWGDQPLNTIIAIAIDTELVTDIRFVDAATG